MTAFEEKYLNLAKEIVLKHIPKDEYAVFLFGSRAEGTSSKFSDIDIGIWGENKTPYYLSGRITDEIEMSNVPYDTDLVDFNSVRDKFKNEALKKIVIWNLPEKLKIKFKNFVKRSQASQPS
jgi:predicted nucleotidyltransferase